MSNMNSTSRPGESPGVKATHELAVCYRIYPRVSGKPIFGFTDKLALVRLNLKSFKSALGGLKVKIWMILDNCPPSYQELATQLFAGTEVTFIGLGGEGNEATFARQIELPANQPAAELVYFAEDDYLYLPSSIEQTVAFMRRHVGVEFATLYDHADNYTKYIHQTRGAEIAEDGHRWRTVASTCLTFMARKSALVETSRVFQTFGHKNSDLGVWLALTKFRAVNPWSFIRSLSDGLFIACSHLLAWRHAWRQLLWGKRRSLWAPKPSLATHMELSGLAPGVDWEKIFGPEATK